MKSYLFIASFMTLLSACQVGLSVSPELPPTPSSETIQKVVDTLEGPAPSDNKTGIIAAPGLALETSGAGYFVVSTPENKMLYTQKLVLITNQLGQLMTTEGYKLDPNTVIPPGASSIHFQEDGAIAIETPQGMVTLGQLAQARFENPSELTAQGEFFEANEKTGEPEMGHSFDQNKVLSDKYSWAL